MMDKTPDAWSLLVQKAQRALQSCEQQLAQARAREAQLRASEQRVQAMLMEYRRRHDEGQAEGQLMADSLNQRQFIAQLQLLLDQSLRATTAARGQCEAAGQSVLLARQELQKAEKLQEHVRQRDRALVARAEQRRDDELATLRYHWRGA